MANPSAAHEPSMEEILASIRQIISEDGEGAGSAKAGAAAAEPPQSTEQADETATTYESVVSRFDAEPEPAPMIEPEPTHEDVIRPPFARTPEPPSEDDDEAPFQPRLAAPASRPVAPAEGPLARPTWTALADSWFAAERV